MTTIVERSIEVAVPVRTVYDQWTQFEEFPRFMSGVTEVRQVGDALTHWVADIGGVKREWDAAILEQVPDEKVAWAATTGATNAGAVYFTAAGDDRTMVRLRLEFEPEGIVERIGDVFDIVDRQAVADLDRFKEYIERAGSATGGWRGTVEEGQVQDDATSSGTTGGGSADEVPGDLVAVGPTGDTRGTVPTEPGPARVDPADVEDEPGVGHSGDPIAVDPPDTPTGAGWDDEPGARSGTTEAVTDPVGEDWSDDAGPRRAGATAGAGGELRNDATTDPVGETWAVDESGVGADRTASDPRAEDWDAPRTGTPDPDVADLNGPGATVPSRTEPSNLDAVDAPGSADGVGGGLDPLDPRVGTADDPNNPQQPSV